MASEATARIIDIMDAVARDTITERYIASARVTLAAIERTPPVDPYRYTLLSHFEEQVKCITHRKGCTAEEAHILIGRTVK